ncbi:MAG: hypothetical protein ACYDH9_26605 [Limisphaerales bacterium]
MAKNLQEWIVQLEQAEAPAPLQQALLSALRAGLPEADFRTIKADPQAARDYVSQRLAALWIDMRFWKLIQQKANPGDLQAYIQDKHELSLPPFTHSVYREIVRDRLARDQLFRLLRSRPSTFGRAALTPVAQATVAELEARGAEGLLLRYVGRSALSRRSWLRWLQLSDATLGQIKDAIVRLDKDIDWCLANPSIKSHATLFRERGQRMSPKHVQEVEEMVVLVKAEPAATNDEIAKRYADKFLAGSELNDNARKVLRSAASHAKHLVEVREGLKVKHHLDEQRKFGRKPRRKKFSAE